MRGVGAALEQLQVVGRRVDAKHQPVLDGTIEELVLLKRAGSLSAGPT